MLSLAENEMKLSFVPELPLELLTIEWCQTEDKAGNQDVKSDGATDDKEVAQEKSTKTKEQVDINGKWPDVLKSIKPYNHSLEMLLRKCHVESFDGETLSLITYYKLHKDLLMHPKNYKVIQDCLQLALGDGIKLELKLEERKHIAVSDKDEELVQLAEELFK